MAIAGLATRTLMQHQCKYVDSDRENGARAKFREYVGDGARAHYDGG